MPRKARNVEIEGAGPRSQRMRSRSGSSSCWHVLRCRCVVRSGCVELLRRLRTPGILVRLDCAIETVSIHLILDLIPSCTMPDRTCTIAGSKQQTSGPPTRAAPREACRACMACWHRKMKHERAPRTPLERATVPRRRPGTRTAWDVARRWLSRILRFQISELEHFAYLILRGRLHVRGARARESR